MPNQTDGDSDAKVMTEAASVPSVQTGPNSIYAAIKADSLNSGGGPSAPQWRKIIRIDFTDKGPVSTLVQDNKLTSSLASLIEDAMAEHADSDDAPEQQQYLMSAWQAMAMYLASCDDEDQNAAATALKFISDMMADKNSTSGPFPDGTFGRTVQTAAAAMSWSCAKCERGFGTEAGLINHLKSMHSMGQSKAAAFAAKQGS